MNALDQISSQLVVIPAYGRKYSTKEAAVQDWKDGKDFKIANGPYCSIRDISKINYSSIWIDLVDTVVRVE
jgi:hypothetical protein